MNPGLFFRVLTASSCLLLAVGWVEAAKSSAPSFNQEIRPILSDNCFLCHGPDAKHRKGKLRLDVREEAVARGAIVPGKPGESELMKRILTVDEEDVMPPLETHKKLTAAQKETLRRWIAAGAEYQAHWAYVPPVKPAVPAGKNAIDYLVERRLKQKGLKLSPEADRRTLIRRLQVDLVGLPPTPSEVEAFEKDRSREAYGRLVERLLASPHYGERMAIGWLDAVRFADTIGYHSDNPRNIWPYRDYVIRSFNQNKPFDRFTREQLAGDLLPSPTQEQRVGSAFNRLLLTTEEGGAQPKDYEARMLTDRVRAVGSVWLGQTLGCCQCHDHKFDPSTQRDFYSLGAFFADIQEPIIGRREEGMLVPDERQAAELARLEGEVKRLQADYDGPHSELAGARERWEREQREALGRDGEWRVLRPGRLESAGGAKLAVQEDGSILASGEKPDKDTYTLRVEGWGGELAALRVEALPHESLPSKGPGRAGNGNFVLSELVAWVEREGGQTQAVAFASARAGFEQRLVVEKNPYGVWNAASSIDGDVKGERFGWAVLPEAGKRHHLVVRTAEPVRLGVGEVLVLQLKQNNGDGSHTLGRFRVSATAETALAEAPLPMPLPEPIIGLLALSEDKRDAQALERLGGYFKETTPELAGLRKRLAEAKKAQSDFEGTVGRCLVSVSSDPPRTVRLLPRGNWMVETGEILEPALPAYLAVGYRKPEGRRLNRLDLAEWLVSPENPLVARVVMNRLFRQFFGVGLSKVADDFGMQGEPPVNPELLDWLACEFRESGWDVKHMVRLMVTSRTYRQVSTAGEKLRSLDPENRELARQGRWRVEAELVRDQALSVSGLLVPTVGGPSVKPYQPEGYWENLNFPPRTYAADGGESQYRRGLYTWWQRSFLHPSLLAFDAPSREECTAERSRSNIPQQALVLLNDPTYVEAARVFAARILREGGSDTAGRIRWAWRQALQRAPQPEEVGTLERLVAKHAAEYGADPGAAEALLKVGLKPVPEDLNAAELAAWTSVARVILNLHEALTRS